MPAPLRLRLDQGTREAVAERYEQACTPIERTNGQVVLLADEGRTVTEIAWLVRRGRDQVRKILHRFRSEGLAGVVPGKHTGRPLGVTPVWLTRIAAGDRLGPTPGRGRPASAGGVSWRAAQAAPSSPW